MLGQNIIKFWNKIKKTMKIKFHTKPIYDEKYIKTKLKEFYGVVTTNVLANKILKEVVHYTFIACISIDSVKGT